MCFGVAPSTYRSIHAVFRSFEPSLWHVAAWKLLLEKHPIARQAFFAIGIVLVQKSLQLTVFNLPGSIFSLLVSQVKIVVIEPAKQISACFQ